MVLCDQQHHHEQQHAPKLHHLEQRESMYNISRDSAQFDDRDDEDDHHHHLRESHHQHEIQESHHDPSFADGDEARIHRCSVLVERFDVLKQHFGRSGRTGAHLCVTCGYETNNKSNLFAHVVSTHVKINPFGCPLCHVASSSHTNLSHHVRRAHNQKLGKALRCNGCSLMFEAPLNLLAHYLEKHYHGEESNREHHEQQHRQLQLRESHEVTKDVWRSQGEEEDVDRMDTRGDVEVQQEQQRAVVYIGGDFYESVRRRMAIERFIN
eukprot:CAMPEP_0185848746 /NCGR_PEP_ID=MMETSP1354-20130828/3505_1 /TAXON_ID=708628 /ORGANISM="Erythrolobus madagascarensis, Strain CCMP3276" /LENGTH=266 /DNA_ID=CAMNT_0028549183 /DNA_START=228 /DNA_END=1028 /DNA_ORIENTATION=-